MYSVIGSFAAAVHFPDFPRTPRDVDILTDNPAQTKEYFKDDYPGYKVDVHYTEDEAFRPLLLEGEYSSPSSLLTLKLSHLQWDVNKKWVTHAKDALFLFKKGARPNHELFSCLTAFWIRKHGPKRAYLKKTNEEFFKDNVNRIYEHDSLHLSVAYGEYPLFESIKTDLNSAYCSKRLFDALPDTARIQCCREEIYVTALERYLIPVDFKRDPVAAYRMALQRLIVSMTAGWFCEYMILNLDKLVNPDVDYVGKFKEALASGKVKKL